VKREQIQKEKARREREPAPEAQKREKADTSALEKGLDELLDEIDGVLEENAEEFVKAYVQKGGE
jgi:ubiquitin-like protein Pup